MWLPVQQHPQLLEHVGFGLPNLVVSLRCNAFDRLITHAVGKKSQVDIVSSAITLIFHPLLAVNKTEMTVRVAAHQPYAGCSTRCPRTIIQTRAQSTRCSLRPSLSSKPLIYLQGPVIYLHPQLGKRRHFYRQVWGASTRNRSEGSTRAQGKSYFLGTVTELWAHSTHTAPSLQGITAPKKGLGVLKQWERLQLLCKKLGAAPHGSHYFQQGSSLWPSEFPLLKPLLSAGTNTSPPGLCSPASTTQGSLFQIPF